MATFLHPTRAITCPDFLLTKASSPKVRLPSKAPATTSVDMASRTTPLLSSLASAGQMLRYMMTMVKSGDDSVVSSGQEPEGSADQGRLWMPLPAPPALEPEKFTPSRISRTPSPPSFSRAPSIASLETVSSSEGPETPRGHSPLHSPIQTIKSPTLSYLEYRSRIRVPGVCVTCRKAGSNFPSCSACGDTWCSRGCRVVATGGKKHNCHRRTVDASEISLGPFEA